MTVPASFYPGAIPTVDSSTGIITMDMALQSPELIRDTIEAIPSDYSFASAFFSGGNEVVGGAVAYEQYLTVDHRFTDRDVQPVAPGAEFPEVSLARLTPVLDKVTKWGGQSTLPYETINRSSYDELADRLIVMSNTIARKTSTVCLAALNAASIQTSAAAAYWTTTSDPIAEINTVITAIRGVEIDDTYAVGEIVAVCHPTNLLHLMNNAKVRDLLPREGGNTLLSATTLSPKQALGVTWVPSNRQTVGTIHFGIQGKAGRIHPERQLDQTTSGMYVRVVDEPTREAKTIMAARIFVPTVAHPKSVYKLTGVSA